MDCARDKAPKKYGTYAQSRGQYDWEYMELFSRIVKKINSLMKKHHRRAAPMAGELSHAP